MTQQHPITPPPELVQEWWEEADQYQDAPKTYFDHIATKAAQWGADQELEACCEHLKRIWAPSDTIDSLRVTRRPKPPSLKEQGIALIDKIQSNQEMWQTDDLDIVRRALESLPD